MPHLRWDGDKAHTEIVAKHLLHQSKVYTAKRHACGTVLLDPKLKWMAAKQKTEQAISNEPWTRAFIFSNCVDSKL